MNKLSYFKFGSIPKLFTGIWLAVGLMVVLGINTPAQASSAPEMMSATIQYSNCNVPELGGGAFYEGWFIQNGVVQSAGQFTVDANGLLSQDMFTVDVADINAGATFVLTIEPAGDTDPGPSDTHILGGDFSNSMSDSIVATIDHGAALGTDFSTAAGSYILAVPTSDGTDGAGYNNGIWFLDASSGTPMASLDLPTLPAGWVYEGWVVVNGTPMSTGTFLDPAMADSDMGGATAGVNASPPFPGQDYVTNLVDLLGGTAVISVEPFPDDSSAPFVLKPLVDMVIDDTGAPGISQALANNAVDLPTCDVAIEEIVPVMPLQTVPATIEYSNCNVPELGGGAFYEGWFIQNGVVQSAGQFTIDANGMLSQDSFSVDTDPSLGGTFVLTIEPAGDTDPGPSATHILAGDFANVMSDSIVSMIDHPAALGTDFSTAAGSYILAVPTSDGTDGASYNNGIWFLDASSGTPMASLDLPTLPAGWVYEGWVVVNGTPMSTGTFLDPAMADSDMGGAMAGVNPAPPFPGQDYVTNLLDLLGGTAVISVEPFPDDSSAPFILKPLVDMVIDDTGGPGISQSLANNAVDLPTCDVSIEEIVPVIPVQTVPATIEYSNCNVPELGGGAFYEGWFIQNGVVQSAGQFTVDASGMLSQDSFSVDTDPSLGGTFVLTIEPAGDTDPGPSATHILAGDFANVTSDSIVSMIDHPAALGTDFSTAAGSYILAVPTSDGTDGASYNNGIWFLDGSSGSPMASLDLPTLPAGWVYEGWVVVGGTPMSTGTFLDPAMADSDMGGATAGVNPAPPFPGQDYVTNLVDLLGGTAVISVEPFPDDSSAPFVLKPLVDMVIDDTGGPGVSQSLANNAVDLPVCTVEISEAPPPTIAEIAVDGGFDTLVAALDAAGLTETLADPDAGPFTVFAPTDEAFAALPDGVLDLLLADPMGALAEILQYHVIAGELTSADLAALSSNLTTLLGEEITVRTVNGSLVLTFLNGASAVIASDIQASNGIVHVIDAVLVPPMLTAPEVITVTEVVTVTEMVTDTIFITNTLPGEVITVTEIMTVTEMVFITTTMPGEVITVTETVTVTEVVTDTVEVEVPVMETEIMTVTEQITVTVVITEGTMMVELDYSDAPSQYPLAGHILGTNLYIGDSVDADSQGQAGFSIDEDQSDNGITVMSPIELNQPLTIEVSFLNDSGEPATLVGYVDLNGDGEWTAADEEVRITDLPSSPDQQTATLSFGNITDLTDLYGRFRITTDSNLGASGLALDGEVEDWLFANPTAVQLNQVGAYATNVLIILFVVLPLTTVTVWTRRDDA